MSFYFHHRYQVTATAKVVGGVDYRNASAVTISLRLSRSRPTSASGSRWSCWTLDPQLWTPPMRSWI